MLMKAEEKTFYTDWRTRDSQCTVNGSFLLRTENLGPTNPHFVPKEATHPLPKAEQEV